MTFATRLVRSAWVSSTTEPMLDKWRHVSDARLHIFGLANGALLGVEGFAAYPVTAGGALAIRWLQRSGS